MPSLAAPALSSALSLIGEADATHNNTAEKRGDVSSKTLQAPPKPDGGWLALPDLTGLFRG